MPFWDAYANTLTHMMYLLHTHTHTHTNTHTHTHTHTHTSKLSMTAEPPETAAQLHPNLSTVTNYQ